MLTSICGINWGDEGKGRMVDLLSEDYDIVCRYQGGNNAGHTVINETGEVYPQSASFGHSARGRRQCARQRHGRGYQAPHEEAGRLRAQGISITPENLKISDKAVITMPYHVLMDCLEEERLADKKFGSTRRGIAPVYADKYMKKAFRMGELLHPDGCMRASRTSWSGRISRWRRDTVMRPSRRRRVIDYLETYGEPLKDYICDVGLYLHEANKAGKNIMFEAQLGALRDIDFGIYPYTSSSSTIAAYAPIGAGVPNLKLDKSVGIMKAYSTCVGEGPFTAEYFGEKAEKLRAAGGEYGAATGRPRRVGPFDVVASRYGIRCQGADEIALTKLDVLSEYEELEICTAYELNGKRIHRVPVPRCARSVQARL